MARRSSNISGAGCGTILLAVIVLAIISAIVEFLKESWQYLLFGFLFIVGGILVILLLIWLFRRLPRKTGNSPARTYSRGGTRVNASNTARDYSRYASGNDTMGDSTLRLDAYVSQEVDRQIKSALVRRRNLAEQINHTKQRIATHNFFWMKNSEKHIKARNELNAELQILQAKYNASVFAFKEPLTPEYNRLEAAFFDLIEEDVRAYNNAPRSGQIYVPYKQIGDLQHIVFQKEPLCLLIGDYVYCIIPYYVLMFTKNGKYITTYTCEVLQGGQTNTTYQERVQHETWTYTRIDGGPDRRYKYNPRRIYYTNVPRTIWGMLSISIVNNRLTYQVDHSIRDNLIGAIRGYSTLTPLTSYDPVHHLVRLMGECDPDNGNVKKLERMIGGEEVDGYGLSANVSSGSDSDRSWNPKDVFKTASFIAFGLLCELFALFSLIRAIIYVLADLSVTFLGLSFATISALGAFLLIRSAIIMIKQHSKSGRPFVFKISVKKICIIFASVAVAFFVAMIVQVGIETYVNMKNAETANRAIEKWKTDGDIDYMNVSDFEYAINHDMDMVGKTVTFKVREVHPESKLGYNLYGGKHLNFVFSSDPGVQKGDNISVVVTGVKHLLGDSYKVKSILLK